MWRIRRSPREPQGFGVAIPSNGVSDKFAGSQPTPAARTASRRSTATERPRVTPAKRSEEHTSELKSLMHTSYAVFFLQKKKLIPTHTAQHQHIIPSTILKT